MKVWSNNKSPVVAPRRARGALLLALLISFSSVSAQTRIGYVDWKTLLENAPQIPITKDKLDREFRQRNLALETDQRELESLEQRIRTEGPLMTTAQLTEIERRARNLRRRINTERSELADEFDFRLSEERQAVEKQILDVIRQYAIENDIDLVTPGPALYVKDSIDLTDKISARLLQTETEDEQ